MLLKLSKSNRITQVTNAWSALMDWRNIPFLTRPLIVSIWFISTTIQFFCFSSEDFFQARVQMDVFFFSERFVSWWRKDVETSGELADEISDSQKKQNFKCVDVSGWNVQDEMQALNFYKYFLKWNNAPGLVSALGIISLIWFMITGVLIFFPWFILQ